ncbi:MAG: hypothetical protein HYV26_10290 [Candidatus Hydrogenedentes bacterium]|nr:hypothetical protein [Candidatus Hydrogenedentota bacterium]
MISRYPPLVILNRTQRSIKERMCDLTGFFLSTRAKSLVAQIRSRPEPDWQAWGPDSKRREFAQYVSKVFASEIGWPSPHFIPDDPYAAVSFNFRYDGVFWDGMELECIFLKLRQELNLEFSCELLNSFERLSFGEVIEILMSRSRNPSPPS